MIKKMISTAMICVFATSILAQEANESSGVTKITQQEIDNAREVNANVCFDKSVSQMKEVAQDYLLLDTSLSMFDYNGCVIEEQLTSSNKKVIARLIEKATIAGARFVTEYDSLTDKVRMVLKNPILLPSKMETRKKVELSAKSLGGVAIGSLAVGYLASKSLYKFDQERIDKYKHTIVGAGISIGTSALTYLALEKTEWGQNLPLSSLARERIILLSGPLMACLAGGAKEVLYDARHKDKHTVDRHDFFATCLGGGGLTVPLIFLNKNVF